MLPTTCICVLQLPCSFVLHAKGSCYSEFYVYYYLGLSPVYNPNLYDLYNLHITQIYIIMFIMFNPKISGWFFKYSLLTHFLSDCLLYSLLLRILFHSSWAQQFSNILQTVFSLDHYFLYSSLPHPTAPELLNVLLCLYLLLLSYNKVFLNPQPCNLSNLAYEIVFFPRGCSVTFCHPTKIQTLLPRSSTKWCCWDFSSLHSGMRVPVSWMPCFLFRCLLEFFLRELSKKVYVKGQIVWSLLHHHLFWI